MLKTTALVIAVHHHSLSETLQLVAVFALLPLVMYAMAGRLMAAQSPGGKLTWTGRRWQKGFSGAVAIWSAGLAIHLLSRAIPLFITLPLWALLGYGTILGTRWLWRDWQREQIAREVEFQRLSQEGKTCNPPPLSGPSKFRRWVLNGYAIALIVGLTFALIRYLAGSR